MADAKRPQNSRHSPDAAATDQHEFIEPIQTSFRMAYTKILEARQLLEDGLRMMENIENSGRTPDGVLNGHAPVRSLSEVHLDDSRPFSPDSPFPQSPDQLTGGSPYRLEVHCFGRFRVYREGCEVENLTSNKARDILKLLVIHFGKLLPKDVIIELLWPGVSSEVANNRFHVTLSDLRRKIDGQSGAKKGPGVIVSRGSNYTLSTEFPMSIDVVDFARHWSSGRRLEAQGYQELAIGEFRVAETLYKGDFLEEDVYLDWPVMKRAELVDIYHSILGKIMQFSFRSNQFEDCIEVGRKIIAKDEVREDAYRYIIRSYLKLGQKSRAMVWYKDCVAALLRELHVQPSAETSALLKELSGIDVERSSI